ncbi:MAG: replication protein [Defluviitaleaceae bacterium]|nr:replication protein [Defluviitaleaceae bacterium]
MENGNKDTRSRKWQLTINNPEKHGYSRDYVKEILGSFKALAYWCMADEIGEEGTPHTHLYMAFKNAARFSAIKKKFPKVHIEMARGTTQENKDYIFKIGKWAKDKKREGHVEESREEYGEIPLERQGARNDLNDLMDEIKEGRAIIDIIEENPQHMGKLVVMEKVKQDLMYRDKRKEKRDVSVTYVHGETRTGKTSSILEKYDYECYRVTDYDNPFDRYNGEDVIVMDEFRNSLKLKDMLVCMEGYPNTWLPARYGNKLACYTKVYIISNWPLERQYSEVQKNNEADWDAFVARIDKELHYRKDGVTEIDFKKAMAEMLSIATPV